MAGLIPLQEDVGARGVVARRHRLLVYIGCLLATCACVGAVYWASIERPVLVVRVPKGTSWRLVAVGAEGRDFVPTCGPEECYLYRRFSGSVCSATVLKGESSVKVDCDYCSVGDVLALEVVPTGLRCRHVPLRDQLSV